MDWGFLKQTLIMFGFALVIIKLLIIIYSLSSISISLLCNGEKTESFTPTHGLRQRDTLSPYLFILCMERLGEMIHEEVRYGRWLPLQVSANGPIISHLFFADEVGFLRRALNTNPKICIFATHSSISSKNCDSLFVGEVVFTSHNSQPCPNSLTSCFLLQNRSNKFLFI